MRRAGIEPGTERTRRRRHHGNFVVVADNCHDCLKGVKQHARLLMLLLPCIEKVVHHRDDDGHALHQLNLPRSNRSGTDNPTIVRDVGGSTSRLRSHGQLITVGGFGRRTHRFSVGMAKVLAL
jgi:hypothetical protein